MNAPANFLAVMPHLREQAPTLARVAVGYSWTPEEAHARQRTSLARLAAVAKEAEVARQTLAMGARS